MSRKSRPYRESLLEDLTDPQEAVLYLNAAKEDSLEMFLVALKDVAQAHQMAKVAKGSGVQRETLYRSFSEQGNPTIWTLSSVFEFLGLDFSMMQKEKARDHGTDNPVSSDDSEGKDEVRKNLMYSPKAISASVVSGLQLTPMMAETEATEQYAGFFPAIAEANVAASGPMMGVGYVGN